MSLHRPLLKFILGTLCGLFLSFHGTLARAQDTNVVFHLRNGDRIAGIILSETTNQVTISTPWIKQLTLPIDQIEKREILPPAINPTTIAPAPVVPAGANPNPGEQTVKSDVHPHKVTDDSKAKPTNSWTKEWVGEIALGTDYERGAADHELYFGKAKLTYAHPYENDPKQFFRNIFDYHAQYGTTEGIVSDNSMGFNSKTDLDLSRRYYLYNLGAVGFDHVRLINLHYEDGPGFGYHWFTGDKFVLNLEGGANYLTDVRSDDTESQSVYFRLAEDFNWKLTKTVNFNEKYEYLPREGYSTQFRMRFEATLSCALIYNLSLNITLADLYDTQPALTVPNNDMEIRTSLGVKF